VPSWLRPYPVLSNGEKFRADLARIICEAPARVVVDEFTSVVDRQIARSARWRSRRRGAHRRPGVLLSCHYDIIDWLEPDWVFDTATGKFAGRGLWRRPRIESSFGRRTGVTGRLFEPHHYLKLPKMIGAICYVGAVDGELVAHLGVAPRTSAAAASRRAPAGWW
jgi:hypothetical protein